MCSRIKRFSCLGIATLLLTAGLYACDTKDDIAWTNAPNVKAYDVTLDKERDGFDRALLSWLSPDTNAKKVYFEYTVKQSTGKPTRFGAAYGKYTTGVGQAQNQGALYNAYSYDAESKFKTDFATVGCTYRLTYDIATATPNNTVIVKDKSGKVSERKLTQTTGNVDGKAVEKYDGESTRFGLYYYANATADWSAQLSVKCYDDTGKDLGLTYHGLAKINVDASTDGMLTTASETDSYTAFGSVYNNSIVKTVYDQGLDTRYVSYMQADETLQALGAQGSVLKFSSANKGTNHSAMTVMFGKKLTKAQIEQGAELIVRAYVQNNGSDYVRYTRLGAPDNITPETSVAFNGSNALSMPMYEQARDGFVDIRLDNDFVKALADANGEIAGIVLYPCSHEPTKFVAYIDEIRYEIPSNN